MERRVVIFSPAEFLQAFREYGVETGKPLPEAPPAKIAFEPVHEVALTLSFPPGSPGTKDGVISFTQEDALTALIRFCGSHNVPLPLAMAKKRLTSFKDGCALMIELGAPVLQGMIIDDHAMMRNIIGKMLNPLGPTQTIEASGGAEALQLIQSGGFKPDLIICDLHMSPMNGVGFLKALRGDQEHPYCCTPVLILTAEKSGQAQEMACQAGASRVLQKPISPKILALHIKQICGHWDI
ncbi:MAG: response regulator [Alphaproteobacteria bacterium]|nr:response regulator [Alphaproteobacteria bacterium]